MTDTTVKVFRSTDSGAPTLSGTAGALITLLDACLTNGYGSITFDSVVIAGNVATCTKSTGHGFTAIGTVGPVIRMEGVSVPSSLNADWRATIVSATVLTFTTTGLSDQTATGTITAKRAPAGWTKAFSGTNLAAYRADDIAGARLYCRIDDTATTPARVVGYEEMTDVNTGTGPFPTATQLAGGAYLPKGTGTRPWVVYADAQSFAVHIDEGTVLWQHGMWFGDMISYKSGDAFHTMMIAHSTNSVINMQVSLLSNAAGWIARSYSQLGSAIVQNRYSHSISSTAVGSAGNANPNPADLAIHFWPIEVWETNICARGLWPGVWNPIHASNLTQGLIVADIPQLDGRTIMVQKVRAGFLGYDITGPWR